MKADRNRRDFLRTGIATGIGLATGGARVRAAGSPRGAGSSVYIMTDLEGVACVLDFENWCTPDSRYHEMAREFLTLEVNAAIEGFAQGGATEFLVADGHGHGAIHPKLLDPRARLARNRIRDGARRAIERAGTEPGLGVVRLAARSSG